MKLNLPNKALFVLAVFLLRFGVSAYGQAATGINSLYYTGDNNSGGLLAGGTTDPHWSVTYANVNGISGNATYQGAAYVVSTSANSSNNYIDSGWIGNTATAQWITAPGARTTSGGNGTTANLGGDQLPGNGTSTTGGNQEGIYIYTLSFNITGSGAAGTVSTSNIAITLTIAADDQYSVYVNPTLNGNGSINTGASTLGGSGQAAWGNTQAVHLQNFADANGTNNSVFKIGVNTITIEVDNTNGLNAPSTATARNASGLLVYQVGSAMTINGVVVPEAGTWLPVVLALGLFFRKRFFREFASTA